MTKKVVSVFGRFRAPLPREQIKKFLSRDKILKPLKNHFKSWAGFVLEK
jgi:hypothetical protein